MNDGLQPSLSNLRAKYADKGVLQCNIKALKLEVYIGEMVLNVLCHIALVAATTPNQYLKDLVTQVRRKVGQSLPKLLHAQTSWKAAGL